MKAGTYDYDWGCQLISDLLKWPLTFRFRQPVDPVKDGAPNYLEIVKNPIDLSAIKTKIQTESYNSLNDMIADIDLIYKNSALFNGEKDLLTYIAKDISTFAHNRLKDKCSSLEEENSRNIQRIMNEINEHLKCEPPKPIPQPKDEKIKVRPRPIEIPPQIQETPQPTEKLAVVKVETPAESQTLPTAPEVTETPISESQPAIQNSLPQENQETKETPQEPATNLNIERPEPSTQQTEQQLSNQENKEESDQVSEESDLPVLMSSTIVQPSPTHT